jgi:hypothetical protein
VLFAQEMKKMKVFKRKNDLPLSCNKCNFKTEVVRFASGHSLKEHESYNSIQEFEGLKEVEESTSKDLEVK